MEYRVLGPLEVRKDDGPLPLGGAKQRALLALLLLNANRVVSRERLIDELWGDEPPATAVTRRCRSTSRGCGRCCRPGRSDAAAGLPARGRAGGDRPAAVRAAGRRGARRRARARARVLLREALGALARPAAGRVRGAVRAGRGGRLEDLRLAALEERIEADLALGRHAELVGELEALIARAPAARAPARPADARALPLGQAGGGARGVPRRAGRARRARARAGRGAAAAGEADPHAGRGARARARAAARAPTARPLPGPLVPAPPFPFVGRASASWRRCARCSSAPRAARAALVLLGGEAGAGKTRLVRELAHEAAARGVLVLYGASDAAVSTPYQPLREWLEFLLRVCDPGALASASAMAASCSRGSCPSSRA